MTTPETEHGTTEANLVDWQLAALEDLRAFIVEHSQSADAPLPVIAWRMSPIGDVEGIVPQSDPSGVRTDRRDVVRAYAEAIGSEVAESHLGAGLTWYYTKAPIGPIGPAGRAYRTPLVVGTEIQTADDQDEG